MPNIMRNKIFPKTPFKMFYIKVAQKFLAASN